MKCIITDNVELANIRLKRLGRQIIPVDSYNHKMFGGLFNEQPIYVYYSDKIEDELFNKDYDFVQISSKIDKRTKLYRQNKDQILELEIDKDTLVDYITINSNLTDLQAEDLLNRCNHTLQIIKFELSKYNNSNLPYEVFRKQIFTRPQDLLFQFCEALLSGKNVEAIYKECKDIYPLIILSVLTNTCKNILQVKTGSLKQTNLNFYVYNQTSDIAHYRTIEQIIQIIKLCHKLEVEIKTGQIDANIVIPYLMLKIKNLT